MSASTPSSVWACNVTTQGVGISVATRRSRSPAPTAHTGHSACPMMTSGRRRATSSTSTSIAEVPARCASVTARSMSPEARVESIRERVTRGSARTSGG